MNDTRPHLIVFSGAGLSADSGIPTFRDADGTWENHDVDQVANGYTWRQNRDLVRRFYNARRSALATVEPNAAHRRIAEWQGKFRTTVLTQNIDDLLERAGCERVVHLHGNLREMKCVACGNTWDIGYAEFSEEDRCPKCNSLKGTRPNVVFFNEAAPEYTTMHHAFKDLRSQDCVVVIGTSGQVINVDAFVHDQPCMKLLNNLAPSRFISEGCYDKVWYGKAASMAPELDAAVCAHMMRNDLGARMRQEIGR